MEIKFNKESHYKANRPANVHAKGQRVLPIRQDQVQEVAFTYEGIVINANVNPINYANCYRV